MKIGVLALQGDFEAHARMVQKCGVEALLVKKNETLDTLDGLILPGGESTTQLKLLKKYEFFAPIADFYKKKKPLFGTCAGLILLARQIAGQEQRGFGLLNLLVLRNAYGSQKDSFEAEMDVPSWGTRVKGCFIRAPRIEQMDSSVEILASHDGVPVLVQENLVLGASFHPELTGDLQIHQYFLSLCKRQADK